MRRPMYESVSKPYALNKAGSEMNDNGQNASSTRFAQIKRRGVARRQGPTHQGLGRGKSQAQGRIKSRSWKIVRACVKSGSNLFSQTVNPTSILAKIPPLPGEQVVQDGLLTRIMVVKAINLMLGFTCWEPEEVIDRENETSIATYLGGLPACYH